jgi:hypothetical protein
MANIMNRNCTIDPESSCTSCGIKGKLECKWSKKTLNSFLAIGMPATLIGFIAVAFSSYVTSTWWYLAVYAIYFFLMFNVFEIRFLCSHCPYYAKSGKTLHCLANHGSLKLWRYRPEPLNGLEKALMIVLIATIFFIGPLAATVYGLIHVLVSNSVTGPMALIGLIALSFAVIMSSGSFVITLRQFFCSKCVNFSCPLNKVSKPVVDAYLKNNDIMREAWIRSGYRLGTSDEDSRLSG